MVPPSMPGIGAASAAGSGPPLFGPHARMGERGRERTGRAGAWGRAKVRRGERPDGVRAEGRLPIRALYSLIF